VRGRDFDDHDNAGGQRVILINKTMAQRFWPNENPIGCRVLIGWNNKYEHEIVGIVEDARINAIEERPEPYLYIPYWQSNRCNITLMVETIGDPGLLANTVRAQLQALDRQLPVSDVVTLKQLIHYRTMDWVIMVLLVGGLGSIGLVLAIVGLYGLVAYYTNRRTKEFGIRIAIGAQRMDVLALVLRQSAVLILIGIGIGLGLTVGFGKAVTSLLYGVNPTDQLTLVFVSLVFALVALLASYLPAHRAMKVDPMVALRYE
jgi:putative ABC transport system permease protein